MVTDSQMRLLGKIVQAEMQLDIYKKTRERAYVNARLIYSYILHERGVTYQRIGEQLGKNHATIINCVRNAKNYFKYEPELYGQYKVCKTIFEDENNPVFDFTHGELLQAYLDIKSRLSKAEAELLELKLNKESSEF
jgi:hypothetical protein